jgi:hypothetical protein
VKVAATAKRFLEMDAGEQREQLTQDLADWIDAGFWSLPRSNTFRRRVGLLARRVGVDRVALLDELRADAESCGATRKGGGR